MREATAYSFRVDTNVLVVSFQEPGYSEIQGYDIAPVVMLDEVMREDGQRGRSQLIFHLSDKTWVSMPMLYDLAMHINHYRPNNRIDWVTSLLDVELHRLAKRLSDDHYVVAHTDPYELAQGDLSPADRVEKTMMTLEYQVNMDESLIQQARQTVLDELKKRHVA